MPIKTDPNNFRKPINFTPSEDDAERLRYLLGRTALRGCALVRLALRKLEETERRSERSGKAAETRAVSA